MNLPRLLFRLLLGRRLPITSGTIEAPGLNGPVVIRRDRYGIPYIEAGSDDDAWYGVGFCQGQDRAFQLDGLLRVARGTSAELVGPAALPLDRLSRHIGFLRSAELQIEVLDPGIRAVLDAFARGVNDGSRVGCRRAAHEYPILDAVSLFRNLRPSRVRPAAYTATDVIAVAKLQAFALSSNSDIELARLKIIQSDGPEAMSAVDPTYPDWHPATAAMGRAAGPMADRLTEDLELLAEAVGLGAASNSWGLGPDRTATGRPILANDAHLRPTLPPHWYLAQVRTPDWAVAGATFVGAPSFPVGHNGFACWGVTAGLADNTDLFIEELSADGHSVREGGRFVPCDVIEEVIQVRGGADAVEEVVVTPRGPVIEKAIESGLGAISIRATWLDPRPVNGMMTVHRARSFDEFRRAFAEWPLTSLNLVYADTSGSIGWQLVGEVPRRRRGWGTVPMRGWDETAGWEPEPVPFEEMPHTIDPESGILATANNRPTQDGDGPFLGFDWIDGYRAARILESLRDRRDWDLAGVRALQMDETSIPWRELREQLLGAQMQGADALLAQAVLSDWDGVVAADSPAAAVFELFVAEISRRVVEAKAPRSYQWALGKGFTTVIPYTFLVVRRVGHLVRLLRTQPDDWFRTGWRQVIEESMAAAVQTLKGSQGEHSTDWAWGRIRSLTLRHPFWRYPLLGRVFNLGPFPWGGDANTVSQAAPDPASPIRNPLAIASLRMVVDVGNWEASRFSLPGGQSGNPFSAHCEDLLPLWKRGDGVPVHWSEDAVRDATRSTLRLMPGD